MTGTPIGCRDFGQAVSVDGTPHLDGIGSLRLGLDLEHLAIEIEARLGAV